MRPENSSGRCSNYVSKQFWSYLAELHAIAEPRVVAIPLPGVPGVTHVRGVVVLLEFGVHLDDPGHPFRHVGRNDCHRERTMCMWRMCHRCQAAAPRRLLDRSSVVECPACRPRQSIPLPQVLPILWRQRITKFNGPRPDVLFQRDGIPLRAAAGNVLDRNGGRLGHNFDGRSSPESSRQPPQATPTRTAHDQV